MKLRASLAVALLAAVPLASSGSVAAYPAKIPVLFATNVDVTDRFLGPTLRRSSWRGPMVARLQAGRYRIRLHDSSPDADFRFFGRGLTLSSSFQFVGERRWTVRLRAGLYRYRRLARERGILLPQPEGVRGHTIRVVPAP